MEIAVSKFEFEFLMQRDEVFLFKNLSTKKEVSINTNKLVGAFVKGRTYWIYILHNPEGDSFSLMTEYEIAYHTSSSWWAKIVIRMMQYFLESGPVVIRL